MVPVRGFLAVVVVTLAAATMAACTGNDGRESAPTATTEMPGRSTAPAEAAPSLEALLAAPADAVAALKAEYPKLTVIESREYDRAISEDVYERYGFMEGVLMKASTGAAHVVVFRLDAFADQHSASAFLAVYHERNFIHEQVKVSGWPGTADFQVIDQVQDISYSFVHGPAVVHLELDHGRFDSPEMAATELGTALDIVKASLDETVPIPE